jgi:hypothetical protein
MVIDQSAKINFPSELAYLGIIFREASPKSDRLKWIRKLLYSRHLCLAETSLDSSLTHFKEDLRLSARWVFETFHQNFRLLQQQVTIFAFLSRVKINQNSLRITDEKINRLVSPCRTLSLCSRDNTSLQTSMSSAPACRAFVIRSIKNPITRPCSVK